ncbi:hypothetical protein K0M31_008960 [Melipona bicolor]|uniref:Uncharacterized protein n=1 Tax=Melipona bicolor TaxID=60889 RepID=A0AA40FQ69_9HYME|nr:hypothetical protein K0M31_008960 [Melipona bicolor]
MSSDTVTNNKAATAYLDCAPWTPGKESTCTVAREKSQRNNLKLPFFQENGLHPYQITCCRKYAERYGIYQLNHPNGYQNQVQCLH